jgi:hypothetical protein
MDRKKLLADLIRDSFDNSQADFARRINRSPSLVNQWLSGRTTFGDGVARHIEITLNLGQGYFDGNGLPPEIESTTKADPTSAALAELDRLYPAKAALFRAEIALALQEALEKQAAAPPKIQQSA